MSLWAHLAGCSVCCQCCHSASAQRHHCHVCCWLLSYSPCWWTTTSLHNSCVPILVKKAGAGLSLLLQREGRAGAGTGSEPPEGFCSLYPRLQVRRGTLSERRASFSEGCLLLLLYMYITSRPDKVASETQWLQLEQEVKTGDPSRDCSPPHPLRAESPFFLSGKSRAYNSFC